MLADWRPGRQLLLCCCSWKLRSGFLLWRHGSINDRKVRPGIEVEEAFPEENWTEIPLSRGRALQRAGRVWDTRLCLPARLAPAGTRSQGWHECGWRVSPAESQPWPPPSRATSVHLQRQLGLVSAVVCAQKGLFHCKIWLLFVIGWLNYLLLVGWLLAILSLQGECLLSVPRGSKPLGSGVSLTSYVKIALWDP